MEEKKKKTRNEHKDAREANPLLMVDPTIMGTPLGPLPIVPIPMLNINDNEEKPEEEETDEV